MTTVTLSEVYRLLREQRVCIEFFGIEGECKEKYRNLCQTLADTIATELGITKEEALKSKLSLDTELGEKALRKFTKLKLWVSENFR